MKRQNIESLEELNKFADDVLSKMTQKDVAQTLGISGDLGTGKTALTKEFAKILSVEEEVTSPTFVIMKSYRIPSHDFLKTLVHIDAYRIELEDEMEVLRFNELLDDSTNLVVIEWPENIVNVLPEDMFKINIEIIDGETREITYNN